MSRKKYNWCVGGPPPPVDPHSVAKHEMLSAYLKLYVQTLARNVKREELRLSLVDGFAGGGVYTAVDGNGIWPGSPIRMIHAMDEVTATEQSRRAKPFRVDARYVFIEKHRGNYEFLNQTLRDYGYLPGRKNIISVRNSTFESQVHSVVHEIKSRGREPRAIFVLDQFGYRDAPLQCIREILHQLEKAEVILTFATDWLLDHVSERRIFQQIVDNTGLGWSAEELVRLKKEHSTCWRVVLQHLLHDRIRKQTGARFYTPFFVHSPGAHRAYWLLHLSRHHRAKDVMTGLHWKLGNHFVHYGKSGLNMLGFDPKKENILENRSEFLFDTSAETATFEALYEELPERLDQLRDGISVVGLFSQVANETPATSDRLKNVLLALNKDKQIRIYQADGRECSPDKHIRDDCVVKKERKIRMLPYNP